MIRSGTPPVRESTDFKSYYEGNLELDLQPVHERFSLGRLQALSEFGFERTKSLGACQLGVLELMESATRSRR